MENLNTFIPLDIMSGIGVGDRLIMDGENRKIQEADRRSKKTCENRRKAGDAWGAIRSHNYVGSKHVTHYWTLPKSIMVTPTFPVASHTNSRPDPMIWPRGETGVRDMGRQQADE